MLFMSVLLSERFSGGVMFGKDGFLLYRSYVMLLSRLFRIFFLIFWLDICLMLVLFV